MTSTKTDSRCAGRGLLLAGLASLLPAVCPADEAHGDGGTLQVTVRGLNPVTVPRPESEKELFGHYIESCNLSPEYDPNAGS